MRRNRNKSFNSFLELEIRETFTNVFGILLNGTVELIF